MKYIRACMNFFKFDFHLKMELCTRKNNDIPYVFHLFLRHDSVIIPQFDRETISFSIYIHYSSFIKQFLEITIFQRQLFI